MRLKGKTRREVIYYEEKDGEKEKETKVTGGEDMTWWEIRD